VNETVLDPGCKEERGRETLKGKQMERERRRDGERKRKSSNHLLCSESKYRGDPDENVHLRR